MLDQGPATRSEFGGVLRTLVGRSIVAVSYHEIAYPEGVPMWNRESASFDSLDFGLTLKLDDGSSFSFTWSTEFTQYNLSIRPEPLVVGDLATSWDATERWSPLLSVPVADVAAFWLPTDAGERVVEYPQDAVILFASGAPVTISAFETRDGHPNWGMMDHVTVFFEDADVRRFGLGPYGRDACP